MHLAGLDPIERLEDRERDELASGHASFRVERVGLRAEGDRRLVGLVRAPSARGRASSPRRRDDEHAGRHRIERPGVADLARAERAAQLATTSWLVGPRGLSMTRTPSRRARHRRAHPKKTERRSPDRAVEHRLDRRPHLLGQAPDEDLVVGGLGAVASRSIGLAEDDLPLRRRREEAERAEEREGRRDGDVRNAEGLREVLDPRRASGWSPRRRRWRPGRSACPSAGTA